ncbi:MAG: hypothetical protein EWM72_02754 [Nitrospira sp.]|nr:MAG: hypothetical protein EWM72_02754 [Nitrospira sp.]
MLTEKQWQEFDAEHDDGSTVVALMLAAFIALGVVLAVTL